MLGSWRYRVEKEKSLSFKGSQHWVVVNSLYSRTFLYAYGGALIGSATLGVVTGICSGVLKVFLEWAEDTTKAQSFLILVLGIELRSA